MGRGGGAALPTATTRGDVSPMVVNISMIALLTVVVASCTGYCAGLLLPRCHDGERRALLDMKKYPALVNSYYSSVMGDWPGVEGGEDCCQWSGITCNNHTGRVIRIDLPPISHPNLASTLVQFKELESLDLEWSTISGTLPNLVCNFKHLKQLQLNYGSVNSSSSSLPSCLGKLNNLEELSLSGIDEYTFPEVVCNFKHLKQLQLNYGSVNSSSSSLPSCLGNLNNLEELSLSGIDENTFPEGLCNMRTLTVIDFFYNRIHGTIPSCLGNLHNLERLDLGYNEISGTIPEGLCNLRHLKQLDLSSNRLNGSIPSCLGNLHNLEVLDLDDNEFGGSIPPSIFPNLTKLTSVGIGGGWLEGTFSFSAFANLSNLERIYIMSSKCGLEIEIESPSWVPSFQLRHLIVYGCSVVNKGNGGGGGRFPANFISTQTRLHGLYLDDNEMTGTLPPWVLCNISSLQSLRLRGNKLDGTFHLAPSCNASLDLSIIDLSHNLLHGSLPTDVGLFFPYLQWLYMSGNQLEGPIPPSLGQAPYLRVLDLSDNQLSGKLPHTLTRNQTALEYLNVSYNQLFGEMLPKDTYMPGLKFLLLHHNSFTGPIPPLLSNFSNLVALDVGHNHLECSLSHCLPSVPSMIALILRKNRLQGHLPTHRLCQMQHLHLLDLSIWQQLDWQHSTLPNQHFNVEP